MRDEGALELIRVHIRLWRVFAGFDGNSKQNLQNELGSCWVLSSRGLAAWGSTFI